MFSKVEDFGNWCQKSYSGKETFNYQGQKAWEKFNKVLHEPKHSKLNWIGDRGRTKRSSLKQSNLCGFSNNQASSNRPPIFKELLLEDLPKFRM